MGFDTGERSTQEPFHILDPLAQLGAKRIAVFHQGRIAQLGAPMALYEQPADEFVAGFLGAPRINLIDRPGESADPAHRAEVAALWGLDAAEPAVASMALRTCWAVSPALAPGATAIWFSALASTRIERRTLSCQ